MAKGDPRHPDIVGIAQHGVVYTGGKGKIAEHGGDDQQDRNVPILVVLPGIRHGHVIGAPVETTQIAPSILTLLGMSARGVAGSAHRAHQGPARLAREREGTK